MNLHDALRDSVQRAAWSPTKLAAEVGRGEVSARQWLAGKAVPSGDVIITLLHRLPGFQAALGLGAADIDRIDASQFSSVTQHVA